ncbi:MAG: NADH:flavin oxidoreductase [bacterium]
MKIFEPGKIGGMEVSNRLVRSATAERMSPPDGTCPPTMVSLYKNLAEGGVGLIIAGHAYVREDGKARSNMTGISRDEHIPGLREVARAVHKAGGKIVAQINHAGRQAKLEDIGGTPVAPSAVTHKVTGVTPRALTDGEIWDLVEAYGEAARRAKEAGFDGVQIHSAHGYLINQFLSGYSNRREDAWGGTPEKRMRFLLEVYKRVREKVGKDYPVLVKMNVDDFIEGGLTIEESAPVALKLQELGIDAVEISSSLGGEATQSAVRKGILKPEEEAYHLPYAKELKARGLAIPLVLVGGLRSLEVMEGILKRGEADFLALSRPLIREPHLPREWQNGRRKRADCISCNKCSKFPDRPTNCEVIHPSQ